MRKTVFAAALITGTALGLAACTPAADEAAEPAAEETVAEEVVEEASTVLDANTATAEELAAVEGVSAELADAIAAGAPYASVVDLNAVLTGALSAEEAAAVLVNVFVPINLNDTTEEELNLIPGMTPKMVHEFEEYVPYEDMAEFDREIGKYVDEAEVARFRNYVTL